MNYVVAALVFFGMVGLGGLIVGPAIGGILGVIVAGIIGGIGGYAAMKIAED